MSLSITVSNRYAFFRSNSDLPNNSTFVNNKSGISISIQDAETTSGNIQLDRLV